MTTRIGHPQLRLATGGGYLVDLSVSERWWVKANVEPFRSESRELQRALRSLFPTSGEEAERSRLQPGIAMDEDEPSVRQILLELERLDLAQRLTESLAGGSARV